MTGDPLRTSDLSDQIAVEVCLRKRAILRESDAKRNAKNATQRYGYPVYYYQCPHCYGFHLTRYKHRTNRQ